MTEQPAPGPLIQEVMQSLYRMCKIKIDYLKHCRNDV